MREIGWGPVFDALERVLTGMGIDFYLIGAVARDIWVDHLSYRDKRTTKDLDISVYVRDLDAMGLCLGCILRVERREAKEERASQKARQGLAFQCH